MPDYLERTAMLLGDEVVNRLQLKRVAVFGIGGVGGYVVEALVRSGIRHIDIIDNDIVNESNINRQIIALRSTVGRYKVDVMKERIRDISPDIDVNAYRCFYLPETAGMFEFKDYSYIADAVDTVTAKIDIILRSKKAGVPVISSMGAGNKLDPTRFEIADIYDTSICPLARVMRRELKKREIDSLKVVYSKEEPVNSYLKKNDTSDMASRKVIPASIAFVPSVAGLLMASEIIKDLIAEDNS